MVEKRILMAAALAGLSLAPFAAGAAGAGFNLPVTQSRLANGMTVLVLPRPGVPVVSFAYIEPVGAQDAPKGKTGLPHMLEHMMFKGTRTIGTRDWARERPILEAQDKVAAAIDAEEDKARPDEARLKGLRARLKELEAADEKLVVKDELSNLYRLRGGANLDAWTSQDATAYTVTLPANQVGFYARVEEDRLSHPVFREFYTERDVVAQERRWRNESTPEGRLFEALQSTAYQAAPYKDPAIGWMGDIRRLLRPDAVRFYRQCYRPDRGVLAVVGGVDPGKVLALFEKTLGRVPNPKIAPLKQDWTREPPQDGEKQVRVLFDADPITAMAWHKPNFPDPRAVALEVLSDILTNGDTSRLVKELVFGRRLVTSISSFDGWPGERDPDLFVLQFDPASGHDSAEVVRAVQAEIAGIQKHGVTPAELKRARRAEEASFLWGKTSTLGMAESLAFDQAVHGDWRWMPRFLDMVREVTSRDIQEAAGRYLVDRNLTIATLQRGKHE